MTLEIYKNEEKIFESLKDDGIVDLESIEGLNPEIVKMLGNIDIMSNGLGFELKRRGADDKFLSYFKEYGGYVSYSVHGDFLNEGVRFGTNHNDSVDKIYFNDKDNTVFRAVRND